MNLTPSFTWYRKIFWCGDSSCALCWMVEKSYWLAGFMIVLIIVEVLRERLIP